MIGLYLVEHGWDEATVGDVYLRGFPAIDRQLTTVYLRGNEPCWGCEGTGRSVVNVVADPHSLERCPECDGRGYACTRLARFVTRERSALCPAKG